MTDSRACGRSSSQRWNPNLNPDPDPNPNPKPNPNRNPNPNPDLTTDPYLRQELFSEMAVVQACAQQHVKLFRRDKPRLRRSMQLLSAYVDEKRDLLQARRGRRGLLLGGGCS